MNDTCSSQKKIHGEGGSCSLNLSQLLNQGLLVDYVMAKFSLNRFNSPGINLNSDYDSCASCIFRSELQF